MPKKNMSPEERKAFGAKMKAARQAKQIEPSDKVEISQDDLNQLLRRIKQLESNNYSQPTATVSPRGIVGTIDKYTIDPKNYPDFTQRLGQDPKLKQFAFGINYELDYEVNITSYETKDGLNMREPRFNLQLNKVVFDDQGEDSGKRIIVRKYVMHEDPQAALQVARDNGVEVDETREVDFLNEMRYLRARDWLMGLFYPVPSAPTRNKRQEVIGGKLVEVYDINSESKTRIPFGELNNKL